MSNAVIFLGPSSLSKHANINTYANTYSDMYILSTLELHLMFNIYKFEEFEEFGYMSVAFKCFKDMLLTLSYKKKDVLIKDWYFNFVSLENIIQYFDNVTIKIYDTPLDSYVAFYNQQNPWHSKLPDILDEVNFYDKFKTFIESPLLTKIKKDRKVNIIGLPSINTIYS